MILLLVFMNNKLKKNWRLVKLYMLSMFKTYIYFSITNWQIYTFLYLFQILYSIFFPISRPCASSDWEYSYLCACHVRYMTLESAATYLPCTMARASIPPVLVPATQSKQFLMGCPTAFSRANSIWISTKPRMPPPSKHNTYNNISKLFTMISRMTTDCHQKSFDCTELKSLANTGYIASST